MFERFYITSKGKMLEARTHAGDEIEFTRVQVGDGALPDGQSIEALTALISPIKYIPISSVNGNGMQATVNGAFSNYGISTSFNFREIGLFAIDPIDGEVLYAYANAGSSADIIPAYSTTPVEFTFSFNITFSNASSVTVTADSSLAFATQKMLNEALELKIDVDDIVNNLTTTTAGKALDARQGKVLSDGIAQATAITNISADVTPNPTYVDMTGTLEIFAYRQGNVVAFHFTFRAAAASVSGQGIFSGLPGAYNNVPFQFTALNVTSQKAVEFGVTQSGIMAYWYSNNGFAAGDQVRGSVTYICAA